MDHNAIWVDLTIVEFMHTIALLYSNTDGALHTVMVPGEPKSQGCILRISDGR